MKIPHDIDTQGIKPHGLDHLKPMFPILMRDSRVVDLSSEDLFRDDVFINIHCLKMCSVKKSM